MTKCEQVYHVDHQMSVDEGTVCGGEDRVCARGEGVGYVGVGYLGVWIVGVDIQVPMHHG